MKKLFLFIFIISMWNNVGYGEINKMKCYFKYSSTVVNFKFDFDNLSVEREKTDNYGPGFILPIIYSKNADANGNHVYSYHVKEYEDGMYGLAVLSSNLDNKLILSILPEIDQIHKLEFDFLEKKKRKEITFPQTNNFSEEFKTYEIVRKFINDEDSSFTERYICDGL
jgi:hypothetical protein